MVNSELHLLPLSTSAFWYLEILLSSSCSMCFPDKDHFVLWATFFLPLWFHFVFRLKESKLGTFCSKTHFPMCRKTWSWVISRTLSSHLGQWSRSDCSDRSGFPSLFLSLPANMTLKLFNTKMLFYEQQKMFLIWEATSSRRLSHSSRSWPGCVRSVAVSGTGKQL